MHPCTYTVTTFIACMTSMVPDTPRAHRLPTRVSNACERCRRNKSRCDAFRPCSLCVRANVECSSSSCNIPSRAPKGKRKRSRSRGRSEASDQRFAVGVSNRPPPRPEKQDTIQSHGDSSRESDTEAIMDAETRQASVADGEADSAVGIAHKICQLSNQGALKRITSAIPGGDVYGKDRASRLDSTQRRPIISILGYPLPLTDTMRTLLEEYFDSVHWFSLVIHEPRFRSEFESIQDGLAYPSQREFLLLLSTVLGMGAWYVWHKRGTDADYPDEDWQAWALSLIEGAGSQLADLMSRNSIASVQACILLGSYYLYHGKPNLSFALLGATIKTAQAIRLHRQPVWGDRETIEERKRVWWAIYTWDRFASVTYGRPLGINDKDCNVTQPVDVYESPYFKANSLARADDSICYSSYQRELNKLYLIASPIIETIFGMRAVGFNNQVEGNPYITQIMELSERLWAWRRHLPPDLLLDLTSDYGPNHSNTLRVHRLQALSLHLTFDNLLIIIHRPLLAQQVDHLIKNQPESGQPATHSPSSLSFVASSSPFHTASLDSPLSASQMSSTDQWWNAALRTSRVTEMPRLAQLATDTHLVAFLAINLFNSAIVMVVMALSDPLSDKAQEVKRTITRIFRLQELLAKKTKLSIQSNLVLKDVIQMLLRREAEAMLAPVVASKTRTTGDGEQTPTSSQTPLMSVEDTLRLPIQPPGAVNSRPDNQQRSTADRALRLNESLASVQRVVPTGFDGVSGDDTADNDRSGHGQGIPNHLSEGGNDAWYHPDLQNCYVNGDSGWTSEDSNVDITGNGLYWFWGPT
ncbi:hypothetical protein F4779DRAFT_574336 [Xylariaceae sp. FL0662B]|nr:hypothetical protein F4779DRAFT_574336 [Xylariaceae sp. FL0662B]